MKTKRPSNMSSSTDQTIAFSVNAFKIGEYQDCRRRFILGEDWWLARWKPRSLFDACLRKAIFNLSLGQDPKNVSDKAQFYFMTMASDPGLETKFDPYRISKDYCAMLSTTIEFLSRIILLKLHNPEKDSLTSTTDWEFSSWADDSGQLHRWIITDSWSDADLPRELHSWRTMGDVAVAKSPMMIHVLDVGQVRQGRPQSPWVRGYRHPTIPSLKVRFRRTQGNDFNNWHPIWLSEMREDPKEWVDLMMRDKVTDDLIHHLTVNVPPEQVCDSIVSQIVSEAMAMREMARDKSTITYDMFPMSRNACDSWTPCPYQNVCYQEKPVDISSIGIYKRRAGG